MADARTLLMVPNFGPDLLARNHSVSSVTIESTSSFKEHEDAANRLVSIFRRINNGKL